MSIKEESFDEITQKKIKETENDMVFKMTTNIIAMIIDKNEQHLKEVMIKYAKKRAEETGVHVEIVFMEKEKVEKIIDLGISEYLKRERNGDA